MTKTHVKTLRQIVPYSRPHRLAKLDGRTREAALMRDTRARLIAHVGGSPSAVELALIERAAQLTLKVAQLDAKLDANAMSDHDHRHYLAWSNSLTRTLEKLGMKGAAERSPSFSDYWTRPRSPGEGARLKAACISGSVPGFVDRPRSSLAGPRRCRFTKHIDQIN